MDITNKHQPTTHSDRLTVPMHISDFDRRTQRIAARTDEAHALLTDDDMSALYAQALVAS